MERKLSAELWDKMHYLFRDYNDRMVHAELHYDFEIDLEDKTDKILDMIITSEGLEKMGMSMIEEGKISMELFLELVTNN